MKKNSIITQEAELAKKRRLAEPLSVGAIFLAALFFGSFLLGIKRTRSLTETNKKIIMNEVNEHNYSRKLRYNMSISTQKTPVNFFFKITGFIRK